MSRIREALVFDNDNDRLAWFNALTPEEQADVIKEAQAISAHLEECIQPIRDAILLWGEQIGKIFQGLQEILFRALEPNAKPRNNKRGKRRKRY